MTLRQSHSAINRFASSQCMQDLSIRLECWCLGPLSNEKMKEKKSCVVTNLFYVVILMFVHHLFTTAHLRRFMRFLKIHFRFISRQDLSTNNDRLYSMWVNVLCVTLSLRKDELASSQYKSAILSIFIWNIHQTTSKPLCFLCFLLCRKLFFLRFGIAKIQ